MHEFAKIVTASDGRQVLFYVEPNGGDYEFHQVIPFDGFMAYLKIAFSSDDEERNESLAYAALEKVCPEHADEMIRQVAAVMQEQSC